MSPVPAAGVVLYRWDEGGPTFLLLKNSLHKSWGFPKGHAEEGEDLETCARREVAEETGGLDYRLVDGFHEVLRYHVDMPHRDGSGQSGYDKEVHYFLGECEEGATEISPEHEDHRWLPYQEARTLLDKPSLRDLLEKAWLRVGEGA